MYNPGFLCTDGATHRWTRPCTSATTTSWPSWRTTTTGTAPPLWPTRRRAWRRAWTVCCRPAAHFCNTPGFTAPLLFWSYSVHQRSDICKCEVTCCRVSRLLCFAFWDLCHNVACVVCVSERLINTVETSNTISKYQCLQHNAHVICHTVKHIC